MTRTREVALPQNEPPVVIVPSFGVACVSNRQLHVEIEGCTGGGFVSSGSSPAGDLALVMAGTYGGAAVGLLLNELIFAFLKSLP